ncbi:hypothetical protein SH139x_004574 [Planctomycetaceae bacterium SH139]
MAKLVLSFGVSLIALAFIRRKGKAPHPVGHTILKVVDGHLMHTTNAIGRDEIWHKARGGW